MCLVIMSLLLWIDRCLALPRSSDQDEIDRRKINDWWLQVYHEERRDSRPTGILRHRRNSSHSTEKYISAEEGNTYSLSKAPQSSPLFAAEKLKSNWENKLTKHVRFELPLTMTAISAVLGDEIDDSMKTMKDHESYHYYVKAWELLTSLK
ncbi:hypothetical protein OnM2_108013 [Erysiphe neolycopersici]|uniref:Uncharacterized protein n=1 Tax=Erysiphe neolycopersici TaxID=212602 RepID=A0A420H6U7_9PEZI|nr:hypothetical protein OnM2_108013 [Erysiphe neolycopersici]